MAQDSYLWTTGGAGDGSDTYTRSDTTKMLKVIAACHAFEGVAPTFLNKCAGSVPGVNTARIASGGAMVDGKPYLNTADVDVTIPSAVGGGNTRIDRVVLRADWTAQTVRVTRIAGVDAGSPTPPAITQNSESTYDIMLYQALVNTSGVVTLTDERVWARLAVGDLAAALAGDGLTGGGASALAVNPDGSTLEISADALRVKDLGITSGKLGANAVIAGKLADGAVDTAARLAANVVTAGKLADGAVDTTARLANDIVDDTKAGNRIPQFYRRQGGDTTDWSTTGGNTYTPGAVRMQAGSFAVSSSGDASRTFPIAFSATPLIYLQSHTEGALGWVVAKDASGFAVRSEDVGGLAMAGTYQWFAIGPE